MLDNNGHNSFYYFKLDEHSKNHCILQQEKGTTYGHACKSKKCFLAQILIYYHGRHVAAIIIPSKIYWEAIEFLLDDKIQILQNFENLMRNIILLRKWKWCS